MTAWMGREFGGECICVVESLCFPPETITTLLVSYTPIQSFFLNVILKNAVFRDFLDGPVGKTVFPSIAG